MYEFVKVKCKGAMRWMHVYLNRENYNSLCFIHRKLANDGKKWLRLVKDLWTKVQLQEQRIAMLHSRTVELEGSLKLAMTRQIATKKQVRSLKEVLMVLLMERTSNPVVSQ